MGVSGDRRVLVFFEAVHLAVVQRSHVVRLPAILLLLFRFLTLRRSATAAPRAGGYPPRAHGSCPVLRREPQLFPVFRVAAGFPPRTLLFDTSLPVLYAPLCFLSEGLLRTFARFFSSCRRFSAVRRSSAFVDSAFLCVSAFVCSVLRRSSRFASFFARSSRAGLGL